MPVRHSVHKIIMYMLLIFKKYESMIVESHMTGYRNANTSFGEYKLKYYIHEFVFYSKM